MKSKNKEKIENVYVSLEIENFILKAYYKPEFVSLVIAKKIAHFRKEYINKCCYPTLVKLNKVAKASKEARDYLSSEEGIEGVTAGAILTKSSFQATFANFFLRVTKPQIPTRLFTEEEKAIEWLSQFRKNE